MQILGYKSTYPDHAVKQITQVFCRFLGLPPIKTHEVRSVLQVHSSSSAVRLSRADVPPLRSGSSNKGAPAMNLAYQRDVFHYSEP